MDNVVGIIYFVDNFLSIYRYPHRPLTFISRYDHAFFPRYFLDHFQEILNVFYPFLFNVFFFEFDVSRLVFYGLVGLVFLLCIVLMFLSRFLSTLLWSSTCYSFNHWRISLFSLFLYIHDIFVVFAWHFVSSSISGFLCVLY